MSAPLCPQCGSEYAYPDGSQWLCPECAHEWMEGETGADDAASKLPRTPIAASVRFERWLFDKASGQSRLLDTRLATLKIGYDPELEMNEEARIENPLGFRVLAYRVDQDSLSSQPAAASATAPEGERDAIH